MDRQNSKCVEALLSSKCFHKFYLLMYKNCKNKYNLSLKYKICLKGQRHGGPLMLLIFYPFAPSYPGFNCELSGLILAISCNFILYLVFLQSKDNIVFQNLAIHNPQGIFFIIISQKGYLKFLQLDFVLDLHSLTQNIDNKSTYYYKSSPLHNYSYDLNAMII